MAKTAPAFSKDFPIDAGIFKEAKLTLAGSLDLASTAILSNQPFPQGNIELGRISFSADTGQVSLKPAAIGGATMSFDISASAQSGMGIYDKSADALTAIQLPETPHMNIPNVSGQRFALMDWGYSAKFAGNVSHPIGALGTVTFGVDAAHKSVFAVLRRYDAKQGAHDVVQDVFASWRLPRHVAFDGTALNIKPATWLIAEADGSLALSLAASLGWNVSFAKESKLLGITQDLSAKIDANLKATFGLSVSGKYVVVVGREDATNVVRLQLFKQATKGLNFGLDLNVGVKGTDSLLPGSTDELVKSTFTVHGLQVIKDLHAWTDPNTTLGQKLAGLSDQTALDLLKATTGISAQTEFDKGKKILIDNLNQWNGIPAKVASMLWDFLSKPMDPVALASFKALLAKLADPKQAAQAVADVLKLPTFGDKPDGQFIGAASDHGPLALLNQLETSGGLAPINGIAKAVLDLLNSGVIQKLQKFIDEKLDLKQITGAKSDADFAKVNQWLQNRLGNFLDKELKLEDLKELQKAINALNAKLVNFYNTGVQALTKRYCVDFAATYQNTTRDTALLDVSFDLSTPAAGALFNKVVAQSNLDELLTKETKGVTLGMATLSHEIKRKDIVELHMPFFDFTQTHVNEAMTSVTAEDQGGRMLMYQVGATDRVTIANRMASQLSVLASLIVQSENAPQFDPSSGSIGYEMRQVKADLRPDDLEERTKGFIHEYLPDLFSSGNASVQTFYTDLDIALTAATESPSNHLGDMALSMQLALPASVLANWLRPRSASRLRADQFLVSQALQKAWKSLLPNFFFQDLENYQFNPAVAALLVWSSLPLSTSLDPQQQSGVFWDWPDLNIRRAVARSDSTVATLAGRLPAIHDLLQQESNGNADFFVPAKTGELINMALNDVGDGKLQSLLIVEEQLVEGASDALSDLAKVMNGSTTMATAPSKAIKALSEFAGDLTDTFNNTVRSIYGADASRVLGSMLLVEASKALGAGGAKPSALLNLYALKPRHAFKLGEFVEGKMPPQAEVALTQTLVSLP